MALPRVLPDVLLAAFDGEWLGLVLGSMAEGEVMQSLRAFYIAINRAREGVEGRPHDVLFGGLGVALTNGRDQFLSLDTGAG